MPLLQQQPPPPPQIQFRLPASPLLRHLLLPLMLPPQLMPPLLTQGRARPPLQKCVRGVFVISAAR
jgi:hypothetical protein